AMKTDPCFVAKNVREETLRLADWRWECSEITGDLYQTGSLLLLFSGQLGCSSRTRSGRADVRGKGGQTRSEQTLLLLELIALLTLVRVNDTRCQTGSRADADQDEDTLSQRVAVIQHCPEIAIR